MDREKSKQANFRLSKGALDVLDEAARMAKVSKTEVVEASIVQYARRFPELEKQARKAMQEVVKRMGIAPFKRAGYRTSGQEEALAA